MPNLPIEPPTRRPPMQGGGCLIAAGVVIGPIVGLMFGQTSLGMVIGLGIGIAGAVLVFLLDRRR